MTPSRWTLSGCLLPFAGAPTVVLAQRATPRVRDTVPADPSAHRSGVVMHDGVRLHYLDWGRTGPAVVLLPGYGLTAHAFDDIGTLLAEPVPSRGFSGAQTHARVRDFLRRDRLSGWSPALEANRWANTLGTGPAPRQALTAGYIRDSRAHPPDLTTVAAPALQVCAVPTVATEYPWMRAGVEEHAGAARYVRNALRPFARRLCAQKGPDHLGVAQFQRLPGVLTARWVPLRGPPLNRGVRRHMRARSDT